MDLRKRLSRLDELTNKSTAGKSVRPESTPSASARRRLLTDELGLQPQATATGTLWWRESARETVARPSVSVPDLAGILPAGTPTDLTWEEILFLDTETTGLAGGTGTLPFYVVLSPEGDVLRRSGYARQLLEVEEFLKFLYGDETAQAASPAQSRDG